MFTERDKLVLYALFRETGLAIKACIIRWLAVAAKVPQYFACVNDALLWFLAMAMTTVWVILTTILLVIFRVFNCIWESFVWVLTTVVLPLLRVFDLWISTVRNALFPRQLADRMKWMLICLREDSYNLHRKSIARNMSLEKRCELTENLESSRNDQRRFNATFVSDLGKRAQNYRYTIQAVLHENNWLRQRIVSLANAEFFNQQKVPSKKALALAPPYFTAFMAFSPDEHDGLHVQPTGNEYFFRKGEAWKYWLPKNRDQRFHPDLYSKIPVKPLFQSAPWCLHAEFQGWNYMPYQRPNNREDLARDLTIGGPYVSKVVLYAISPHSYPKTCLTFLLFYFNL